MSVRTGVNEYNQPTSDISSGYVGEFKYFGFDSVPPHCLACDGSEVSRETYSELFAVFGETFGAGDGATTFNLPDLRGQFVRGTGGNAAALGVAQEDAIRDITGGFWDYIYQYTATGRGPGTNGAFYQNLEFVSNQLFIKPTGQSWETSYDKGDFCGFDVSRVVPTAEENRPVNYAVNICVVYE